MKVGAKFEFPEGFEYTPEQRAKLLKAYHRILAFTPSKTNLTYNEPANEGVDSTESSDETGRDRITSIER